MTDEQLDRAIAFIEEQLAKRDAGANAKVIEGVAEPAALPPPPGPNKVMDAADTADKPRKRKVPSPPGA